MWFFVPVKRRIDGYTVGKLVANVSCGQEAGAEIDKRSAQCSEEFYLGYIIYGPFNTFEELNKYYDSFFAPKAEFVA
ncbi:MAG: hypothetical protein A3D44_00455 [Candidatus Staskawiczbacteria bacterium RIFCSPHIGHO2_02_FULL_42_22]|uniref:Uncharacterized protein n=1 Tax=Candidatus Staskawiczbacteria bacterium RIFCSPHIGHO2_02_FULL_42_22 TaxID=1802207 RepID=A0A1G2I6M5_9BACT|nr:MAG: hypothetical protein A3D44_00455 [Candidatus Staskawiczbacteria bacterium RIFCSPHIGHO2_02_FULL_42_22]